MENKIQLNSDGYFVVCEYCGNIILSDSKENVIEKVNKEGWRYYERQDLLLCDYCKNFYCERCVE
jgi:uncharacterized protein with PIN domain